MNTYTCTYGNDWPVDIVAETASKARYQYYNQLELCEPYSEVFRWLKSKIKHKFKTSDLFGSQKQFESVCKSRGIEFAYIGMLVSVDGKNGIITGANDSQNIDICFVGNHWSDNCHPYYKIKYYSEKAVLIAVNGKTTQDKGE